MAVNKQTYIVCGRNFMFLQEHSWIKRLRERPRAFLEMTRLVKIVLQEHSLSKLAPGLNESSYYLKTSLYMEAENLLSVVWCKW